MTTATNIVEHIICARAVADLLGRGYEIAVDNGEDKPRRLSDRDAVLRTMFATDDEYLNIYRRGKRIGWVRLVYGNDGFDVMSDYTVNLEKVLKPANDLANRLEKTPTEWLLAELGVFDALKLARECIGYCRKAHRDAQSGSGLPVEVLIDSALASATGAA